METSMNTTPSAAQPNGPCPVIFDLDGTLIDSAPDIRATANAVLRLHGVRPLTLDQVRSFIGGGVDLLWRRIIAATGIKPEAHRDLVASFMTRYHHATALTRLYPGVTETLGALADLGHPLGICTNKPTVPARAILDHFGIAKMFGTIIGGDTLPVKKPDPAPLLAAFDALGAQSGPYEAGAPGIFVGDSEFDAACAKNAAVPFYLFTRGYRSATIEDLAPAASFDDFTALPALLQTSRAPVAQ